MIFFKWSAHTRKQRTKKELRIIRIQNTIAAIQLYNSNLQARAYLSMKVYQHLITEKRALKRMLIERKEQNTYRRVFIAWDKYKRNNKILFMFLKLK